MNFKNVLLVCMASATAQVLLADQRAQEIAKMCLVENDERLAVQVEKEKEQFERCMQYSDPVECHARRDEFLKHYIDLHKQVRDSFAQTAEGKEALRELRHEASQA